RSGLAGLRRAVATLASMRVDDRGLLPSLERLAADFQDSHEVAVSLAIDGADKSIPPKVEEALFRVAQEALANVERHAQATSVTVSLDLRDDEVVLRVRDDGLGLGRSFAPSGTGLGLELARRALDPVGGTLDLHDGAPGVEVVARVPSRPAPVEAAR
ncbi:MAG: sensor histidine kinase, partial [Actinobacteria bacterium]|nr:sensor histidine kinase [Actinomycetota bacterium]